MTSTSALPTQAQAKIQALLNGPAGTPPVGVLPTLDNSSNMATPLTIILCLTSATLLVLLRMYTKLFILRSIAYEDCGSHDAPLPIAIQLMQLRCYRVCLGKIIQDESFASWYNNSRSQLTQIGLSVPSLLTAKHGGGLHMWQIQLKSFFTMLYV